MDEDLVVLLPCLRRLAGDNVDPFDRSQVHMLENVHDPLAGHVGMDEGDAERGFRGRHGGGDRHVFFWVFECLKDGLSV